MTSKMDLLAQISELQEAVSSMKSSLTEAVTRLAAVTEDGGSSSMLQQNQDAARLQQQLQDDLQQMQTKCDGNTTQVVKLVLALKGDVSGLKKEMSAISERQDALQRSLDALLEERQKEPHSKNNRSRGTHGDTCGGGRSSGGHSNDSGVALLLEKAHQAFMSDALPASPSASLMHRTSDQDSLPEQPSLLVPPLVYDYVAGLSNHAAPTHNISGGGETDDLAYDSDSSLTFAANKSISLSATISKEMRAAGLAPSPHAISRSSDPARANSPLSANESQTIVGSAINKPKSQAKIHSQFNASTTSSCDSSGCVVNRTDSDGSDQSRDVIQTGRRRRYEKGLSISSTGKLYGPLHRSLSQDSATYAALSCCGPLTSAGLYSLNNHDIYSHTSHHHHHHHQQQQIQRDIKDSHRCRVARELLETEKKYCRTLWIIQDTFAEPLKKRGILSQPDIDTLFPSEVYQLYDKHCHLQHQLRERLVSWQWQPLVGDILAKFTEPHQSDVLRLYTSYVNDFPEVLKTFNKLCRNSPPFTKFIKSCLEQPSCGGLDLGAFLLTPVQRIPRYILLLKQLLKYTDETHPDFHHINVCLDRLKDFLERLNDSIEHSFQLVHATFSGAMEPTIAVTRTGRSRASRSPRRSESTAESPTYRPERLTSRSADRVTHESPECTIPSSKPSPKRSSSMAGGPAKQLVVSKRRPQSSEAGRSRSLPRAAPLNPDNEDPPTKQKKSKRPARPLPTARSVADMTKTPDESQGVSWDEFAASEPSLLDKCGKNEIFDVKEAQSVDESEHDSPGVETERLPNRQDASHEDGVVKKKSIKTSLKNMFTFKKRPSTARGMREEGDYWDPQTQSLQDGSLQAGCAPASSQSQAAPQQPRETSQVSGTPSSFSPSNGHYQTLASLLPPQQTHTPLQPSTPVPGQHCLSVVGDFVDEDGNPCSNV
ncbi:uncharacterized protein LOC108678323 isoform X2 [Hyalella azteca]|uniref:Uncharacterized protein LOC108678323 isoform X2 n=1 Tax=Hyalella azteca TaxID=294128 RepID=A0A8B7P7Q0_HYAAZ|nr:uncharacterized protein LOC108678323 isoform X2 [Hyalella azteca]